MKKINRKGFTLIELLLVIAIIGILAAVLFVSLGSQRDRARVTAFKESTRSAVAAGTICRDQGATVQSSGAAAGGNVCSNGAGGTYVQIDECNGSGVFVQTTAAAGGVDTWTLTSVCTRSDAATCTALCDVSGCVYTPSAAGACN